MNKAMLAAKLADQMGLTKRQGEQAIELATAIITEELSRQGEVTIAGFGTFSSRIRSSRMGVNPRNPSERIRVPEVLVPKFKAGKALKDALKAAHGGGAAPAAPAPSPEPPATPPASPSME